MSVHEMTEATKSEFLAAFRERFGFGEMTASANPDAHQILLAAAWAWQASRATVVIDLSAANKVTALPDRLWILGDAVVSAIEAAGVKVKP